MWGCWVAVAMPVENAGSLGGRTIVKHSDSTTNSLRLDLMSISPEMDYPVYLRSQPSKSRFFRSRYFFRKSRNKISRKGNPRNPQRLDGLDVSSQVVVRIQCRKASSSALRFGVWAPENWNRCRFRGLALWFIGNSILRIFNLCKNE